MCHCFIQKKSSRSKLYKDLLLWQVYWTAFTIRKDSASCVSGPLGLLVLPFKKEGFKDSNKSSERLFLMGYWWMWKLFHIFPFCKSCDTVWNETIFVKGERNDGKWRLKGKMKVYSFWILIWWERIVLDCAVFLILVQFFIQCGVSWVLGSCWTKLLNVELPYKKGETLDEICISCLYFVLT